MTTQGCWRGRKFLVSFEAEELEALRVASVHHYDGVCKSLTEDGGILAEMQPGVERRFAFRELDLLCKVAEQIQDSRVAFPLQIGIRKVLAIAT